MKDLRLTVKGIKQIIEHKLKYKLQLSVLQSKKKIWYFIKSYPEYTASVLQKAAGMFIFMKKSFSYLNPGEDFLGEIIKKKIRQKIYHFSPNSTKLISPVKFKWKLTWFDWAVDSSHQPGPEYRIGCIPGPCRI